MNSTKTIPVTFALIQSGVSKKCGTIEELMEWFSRSQFRAVGAEDAELLYVLGATKPGPDLGHLPWLDTSKDPAVWRIQRGGKWVPVHAHKKGELRTRVRLTNSVAEELAQDTGWVLCDAQNPLNVNLTTVPGFFAGTAPDWDVYTVNFIGYGDV
jgi:hypothetical protein